MPPAVIGAVGLAASVAGSVAQMSSQSKAARKQDQALEEQVQSSQQRLTLSYQNQQIVREQSKIAQAKEQEQLKANHQQNLLVINEQRMQAQLAGIQSQAESSGIRNDAKAQAANLLKDYSNQTNQLLTQSENEMAGLNQATDSMNSQESAGKVARAGKQGSPNTVSSGAREQTLVNQQAALDQGVQGNAATRDFQARNATEYGNKLSENLIKQAETAAGYIESTQANQNQTDANTFDGGVAAENFQNRRNLMASKAAFLSAQGQNSTQYLGQLVGERAQISQATAQRGSIQRPGILSYATLGIGAATQAYQQGLFSLGRSTGTPSSRISTLPPPVNTNINSFPPTNTTYSGTTGNEMRG